MARLPQPGGDDGTWGALLNDFLVQEHNSDGSLKIKTDGTLASKANDNSVVHLAGNETLTGAKDFTGGLTVNGNGVVIANDSRLMDQRTPLDGSVTNAKIATGANIDQSKIANLVADLASKYTLPATGVPETDLDAAVQTKLNNAGASDATVAGYIQDTTSSTYAALVSLIQNIYQTSYTPLSVVGTRTGAGPLSGAYPAGAAAGDVAIVSWSATGGAFSAPPSGWSTLSTASASGVYYGCSMAFYAKVLTAADISGGITSWSASYVYALHVIRGITLPTDVLVQNGWADSLTYQLPTITATARAPKLVTTIMTIFANPVSAIQYPSPYTDFVEFYSNGTSYVAQGILQGSTTASTSFGLSDPNGHATWRTVSISLGLSNP